MLRESLLDDKAYLKMAKKRLRCGDTSRALGALYKAGSCFERTTSESEILASFVAVFHQEGDFETATKIVRRRKRLADSPLRIAEAELQESFLLGDWANPAFDCRQSYTLARNAFGVLPQPKLAGAAIQQIVWCLSDLRERPQELAQWLTLLSNHPPAGEYETAHRKWLVGAASREIGKFAESRELLHGALAAFRSLSLPAHEGLCCLDLALTAEATSDTDAASEVSRIAFFVLAKLDRRTEAYRALATFLRNRSSKAPHPSFIRALRRKMLA